ncbi:MAG: hypothetical protein MHMPM18_003860 [Marteilia pararefringens]
MLILNRHPKLSMNPNQLLNCHKALLNRSVNKVPSKFYNIRICNKERFIPDSIASQLQDLYKKSINAYLHDLIQRHASFCDADSKQLYEKCLRYNTFGGKNMRADLLMQTFWMSCSNAVHRETNLCLVVKLAALVEIFQGMLLLYDDIQDKSEVRRGKKAWYLTKNRKEDAAIDGLFLNNLISLEIGELCSGNPKRAITLTKYFNSALNKTIYGQNLDTSTQLANVENFDNYFNIDMYKKICKYKTSYYSFILPIKIANFIAKDTMILDYSLEDIIDELAICFQSHNDCADFYNDQTTIVGRRNKSDIEERKCSWLLLAALKHLDGEAIQEFKSNFIGGKTSKIAKIYTNLKLDKLFAEYHENYINSLERKSIQEHPYNYVILNILNHIKRLRLKS